MDLISLKLLFFLQFLGCCLVLVNSLELQHLQTAADLEQNKDLHRFVLSNAESIPMIGLGTSRIGQTDEDVIRAIKDAIDIGYRHIDTADFYQNEKAIGQALEDLFKSGKINREDLFITTKVWSNHHSKSLASQSVRDSLENLRLDYLDLVLVHWPMTFRSTPSGEKVPQSSDGQIMGPIDSEKENYEQAYQGLEEAMQLNLTRSIGVSNFNRKQLKKLLEAEREFFPVVNQVECHPYLNQEKLLEFCKENNIYLVAYSPLRRGDRDLLENETLKKIAANHSKSIAQVILRWHLQRNIIIIPRSSNRARMLENFSVFDFELTPEEMDEINLMNKENNEGRVIRFESAMQLPEYPFNE
ncbi:hypothetical protein NH340_JMT04012 [Sarcoptes scabiei]|nr:hypothetical protein NH340_JMT04012 [Sarcoptes scabiei]